MDKLAELAGPELGPNFYELWKVSSRVLFKGEASTSIYADWVNEN